MSRTKQSVQRELKQQYANLSVDDDQHKVITLNKIAQALAQAGHPIRARQVLLDTFTIARLTGRTSVFEMLQYNAPTLAILDQGETLWQVYEAVMEVEGWWGSGRMRDET
jgi:hypothetical protein